MHRPLLSCFVVAAWSLAAANLDGMPLRPAGAVAVRPDPVVCAVPDPPEAAARRAPGPAAPAFYPLHDWPLVRVLGEGLALVNYVDDDQASPAIVDYSSGPHAYDGHRGTDLTLLDFRLMDRGEPVLASAAGTVAWAEHSRFDRNKGGVPPDDGNYVALDHGDGSFTWYLHLRRNSLTAEPGEFVPRGRMIGCAGSSGYSTAPHLHFEPGEYVGGWWTHRDPWNGPNNPLPSLWTSQLPYVGDDPLQFHSIEVFTEAAGGGNIWFVPYSLFVEGLSAPAVFGTNEPFLAVRLQYQGQAGDAYRLEVRKPNGDLYGAVDYVLPSRAQFDWTYWIWYFAGYVSAADHGAWSATALIGGQPVAGTSFQVGASTEFAPRFWPVAGRSIRMDGSVQLDTLRVSALGGPVTFSLAGAPAFVTLESDSIVRLGSVSNQPTRSLYFQAVATDASARSDTMWYHVVDPSKPQEGALGVVEGAPPVASLGQTAPNPFASSTAIRFRAAPGAHAALRIFDVRGRLVRTLFEGTVPPGSGEQALGWDGNDDAGRRVRSGVYVSRLETRHGTDARKLVLLD